MATFPSSALLDPGRLQALRGLALLDTPPETAFDRLTSLVTRLLRVPVALVSLVEADRQFFKSCVGVAEPWASMRETPLSHSFCQHAVTLGQPLVIEDARDHPLVRDNLAIPDLGVVAYAGIPLQTSDGYILGTLCAIDSEPRAWSEEDMATLSDLAASVMTEIELRDAVREVKLYAERVERLQAVTAALSEALTPGQVADVVFNEGLAALDASGGFVAILDENCDELEIISAVGYEPAAIDAFRRLSIEADVPVAEAARREAAIYLDSPDAWMERYPRGLNLHQQNGFQGAAALPLLIDDRVLGALALSFAEFRALTEDERRFIEALAAQCAQAIERSRLYAAAQDACAMEEEMRDRLEFLLNVSSLLADTLDYSQALDSLARLVVEVLGDACVVDVVQPDGGIQRVAAVLGDESQQDAARQLRDRFAPHPGTAQPASQVIATGRSLHGPITDEVLRQRTESADHFALVRSIGMTSYMCVPLTARGRTFGALTIMSCSTRHDYDEADLALAEDLARRAAVMIDNARLYGELRQGAAR